MALTLNNFIGFETGGGEEASATTGTPTFPTSPVKSGTYTLNLNLSSGYDFDAFISSDGGGDRIVGFWIRVPNVTSNTQIIFLRGIASGSAIFQLRQKSNSGSIEVVDDTNSVILTSSNALIKDVYSFIEFYWEESATGNCEIFIDGNSGGTASGDFLEAATLDIYRLSGDNFHFDSLYCLSGATAASDRLGDAEVFSYQNTVEDATDQGDTLALTTTWSQVGETPLDEATSSNDAIYQDTGSLTGSTICDAADSNARPGPSGDANIDGDSNIKGAKWVGRFKRGAGAARTHNFYGGNDGAGANHATWIASNDAKTLAMTLGTTYATFEMISEGTEVPNSSEDFQWGFSKDATAGQDIFCGEGWAMILHVPSAVVGTTRTNLLLLGVGH